MVALLAIFAAKLAALLQGLLSHPTWTGGFADRFLVAGDLNGDGLDEVIVWRPEAQVYSGGAFKLAPASLGLLRFSNQSGLLACAWIAAKDVPGGWHLAQGPQTDVFTPAGDVDHDGADELLVQSPAANRVGLLGRDEVGPGLRCGWVAETVIQAHPLIPSATPWPIRISDRYVAVGDLDGDGFDELIVVHASATEVDRLGLIRWDREFQGLLCTWSDVNVGRAWRADPSDRYVAAGDVDADGRAEVVVHRVQPNNPPTLALVRMQPTQPEGLEVAWSDSTVPGAGDWVLTPTDRCLPVGDVDGDGRDELVIWGPQGSSTRMGLIRFDAATGGLMCSWQVTGALPGTANEVWTLSAHDEFVACGDWEGDGRTEVLARSLISGVAGATYACVLRYDDEASGLQCSWITPGGTWGGFLPTEQLIGHGDVEGVGRGQVATVWSPSFGVNFVKLHHVFMPGDMNGMTLISSGQNY
jgi:hypothetical protein